MAETKRRQGSAAARGSMKSLGARLRQLREERSLSQREFSDLVGVEVMQINRYERGVNVPSIETTLKIARALHITTDELLDPTVPRKAPDIRNPKLYERFVKLDGLPKGEQETAISILDGVIAKYELARIAGSFVPASAR